MMQERTELREKLMKLLDRKRELQRIMDRAHTELQALNIDIVNVDYDLHAVEKKMESLSEKESR